MNYSHFNTDDAIRLAAFEWLSEKVKVFGEVLHWTELEKGFSFQGNRITTLGRPGIWKPAIMEYPLSIRTVYNGHYPDSTSHEGIIQYHYQGDNPERWDNRGLKMAMINKLPLIYFRGVAEGRYAVLFPVFITNADSERLMFTVQVDQMDSVQYPHSVEDAEADHYRRKYITANVTVRLHQHIFREVVLDGYRSTCTICKLRHPELLDAAHIIPDTEEKGEPIISNGLSLCKIHHASYDNNILGITPNYQIKIRDDILNEIDGPMLRYGLQSLENQRIILPSSKRNYPDRDRLERRFKQFREAG